MCRESYPKENSNPWSNMQVTGCLGTCQALELNYFFASSFLALSSTKLSALLDVNHLLPVLD